MVITDDSSRDLVNELIHHSFISEVRLKHTDSHYILQMSYFHYAHHLKAYQYHLLHVTWNHFLFTSCPMPIFCHQFPQEDGDKIVAFLEEALNRHRGSAGAITTIWMTMVMVAMDIYMPVKPEREARQQKEKDNGNKWYSLSVSMDNWNCGQKRQNMAHWFYDNMRLSRLGGTRNAHPRWLC